MHFLFYTINSRSIVILKQYKNKKLKMEIDLNVQCMYKVILEVILDKLF